jgi:hypothetical protein
MARRISALESLNAVRRAHRQSLCCRRQSRGTRHRRIASRSRHHHDTRTRSLSLGRRRNRDIRPDSHNALDSRNSLGSRSSLGRDTDRSGVNNRIRNPSPKNWHRDIHKRRDYSRNTGCTDHTRTDMGSRKHMDKPDPLRIRIPQHQRWPA